MVKNDPFKYRIEPPDPVGDDHVRIVVHSPFNPTAAADTAEVRAGLRSVAGILGRLAVHHHDSGDFEDKLAITVDRDNHGCGGNAVRCAVNGRGLINPYAVLLPDADPFGPPPSVPAVAFTVPAERADAWDADLRRTLTRLAEIDEWTPTDDQRHTRALVHWYDSNSDDIACALNEIPFDDSCIDTIDDLDYHFNFTIGTPFVSTLDEEHGGTAGTLATIAQVYAARRESSRKLGRVIAEMAAETDRTRMNHKCATGGSGFGCTFDAGGLLDVVGTNRLTPLGINNRTTIRFQGPTPQQVRATLAAVRTLLEQVDAADNPAPLSGRGGRR